MPRKRSVIRRVTRYTTSDGRRRGQSLFAGDVLPGAVDADRLLDAPADQEIVAEEQRDLQGVEIDVGRVGRQALEEQERVVVEGLELGRMPVALRVLDGEPVNPEFPGQECTFGFVAFVVQIDPDPVGRCPSFGQQFGPARSQGSGFGVNQHYSHCTTPFPLPGHGQNSSPTCESVRSRARLWSFTV